MAVLVTGGAGYIGSHTVAELLAQREEVVIVDNLATGHAAAVLGGTLYSCDLRDRESLRSVFREHEIESVVHFAASSLVGESMRAPERYYDNNVHGSWCLLEEMRAAGVRRLVFSSTAAIYGHPKRVPIVESDSTAPVNVYGDTKLAVERMLHWYGAAHGLAAITLRYFNAAGAHASGRIGEDHQPETHLIPLILQTALGQRESVAIYGMDYGTPDGTCIRDYVHVSDLAAAHVLSLKKLREGGGSAAYNLGSGHGFSVREVINAAREITYCKIPTEAAPRRPGDPDVLVASPTLAQRELGWQPQFTSLEAIVSSAWVWHQSHPQGYGKA